MLRGGLTVGISVQWYDDEKTIIVVTFDAEWTWKDVHDVNTNATVLYESVDYIVDILADVRNSHLVTTGILSYAQNLLTMPWHPHAGNVVVVGASRSVRTLFEAAALVARKSLERITFAQSMDEARDIIQRRRVKR